MVFIEIKTCPQVMCGLKFVGCIWIDLVNLMLMCIFSLGKKISALGI